MANICGNCRYWVKGSNMPRNAATFGPEGGECRKLPPRGGHFHVYQEAQGEGENLNKVSIVSFPFPPTHFLDWCAEWSLNPFPQASEAPQTEFEIASAKYQKAKEAYWKAESTLAAARHELTIAERARSAAFDKEIEAARARSAVSAPGESNG